MENKTSKSSTKTFNLDDRIFRLLINEPFFAGISRRINKVASKSIPTAGVWVNPSTAQFELLYNPEFMGNLNDLHKSGVLKHEFYHLIFEHVTGRKPVHPENPTRPTPQETHLLKLWNYAADLAINSHISNELPEFCCVPGRGPFKDLPADKSAEWYYDAVKDMSQKAQSQRGQAGKGSDGQADDGELFGSEGGQFDSHDKWDGTQEAKDGQAGSELGEIAKERLKDIIRKAAQEAGERGWGSVPSSCQKQILDLIRSRIDWRKLLRYFIKTSQCANKSSTVRRINKRFQYIHPGRRVNRTAKIAIAIDQSGSVSDAMLTVFFSELNKLASYAEFTVIPFDSDVVEDKVFIWKRGKRIATERVSCGGTDFNPPTAYANKGNYDGFIIMTDLCAPKPQRSRCQRIWITTEDCAQNPYFQTNERIVGIPAKDLK